MKNPVIEKVKSITTAGEQFLVLDGIDVEKIRGRNVCIVDDVVSTGGSLKGLESLLTNV
jgi:adenine phosphoribosyltransferase